MFLNIPALVTIVLCYVWFGLTEVAAIAVVDNMIPRSSSPCAKARGPSTRDLLEMAQVFRFGRSKTLRHVMLPELAPFPSPRRARASPSFWKIVLVVELLGRSTASASSINLYFQLFDVAGILAYTIAFVVVIQAIEYRLLQAERRGKPLAPMSELSVESAQLTSRAERRRGVAIEGPRASACRRGISSAAGPVGLRQDYAAQLIAGLDRLSDGAVAAGRRLAARAPRLRVPEAAPAAVADRQARISSWCSRRSDGHADVDAPLLGESASPTSATPIPGQLSLGMARRAALARAFAIEPDLLLMDEPFVSLDERTAVRLRALLLEIWRRRPTTVLFVSHDTREAVQLADRIILLTGSPGSVEAVIPVDVPRAERADPARLEALRRTLLGDRLAII